LVFHKFRIVGFSKLSSHFFPLFQNPIKVGKYHS
jgi:hypothetical protein